MSALATLRERNKGFSLIELMIVLAIVGILAAVGNASYQSQVKRGLRADAQRTMMEIASKQEQYMMNNQVYTSVIGAGGLNYTIDDTVTDNYTITVTALNPAFAPPSFEINAAPMGQMADDGPLSLHSNGTKTPADKW